MKENIDGQAKKMIFNIFLKLKRGIISSQSKSYTGLWQIAQVKLELLWWGRDWHQEPHAP